MDFDSYKSADHSPEFAAAGLVGIVDIAELVGIVEPAVEPTYSDLRHTSAAPAADSRVVTVEYLNSDLETVRLPYKSLVFCFIVFSHYYITLLLL